MNPFYRGLLFACLTHVACVVTFGLPPVTHPWRFGANCFLMGSYVTSLTIFGIQAWLHGKLKEAAGRNQHLRRRPDPRLN